MASASQKHLKINKLCSNILSFLIKYLIVLKLNISSVVFLINKMSYNTRDLTSFNINADINNLHNIIHNMNKHRIWWKSALVASLGFIGLAFVFIWVLYAVNDQRTKEFDALIYSSAAILIVSVSILTLLFFYRNSKEAFDFGDKIMAYINKLNREKFEQELVDKQKLQQQQEKTRRALKATDILAERSRQSALGAADVNPADRYIR